jgi:hypothetical protein
LYLKCNSQTFSRLELSIQTNVNKNKCKQIIRHYSLYTRATEIGTSSELSLCIHFPSWNKRKIIKFSQKRMQRKYGRVQELGTQSKNTSTERLQAQREHSENVYHRPAHNRVLLGPLPKKLKIKTLYILFLHVALYGCVICTLAFLETNRSRLLEKRMLRRIFGFESKN